MTASSSSSSSSSWSASSSAAASAGRAAHHGPATRPGPAAFGGADPGAAPPPPGGPGDHPDHGPEHDDSALLAALLDGMDTALIALAADGTVTHWNGEAERILGWTAADAVGRTGLAGWAVRPVDADDVTTGLRAALHSPGRQVREFALLTKDGHRVLVRTQSSAVRDRTGRATGVYCAFSEVHTQIDLERAIALSEALFADTGWGLVLVDADLRPAVVNAHAARALGTGRTAPLGRPLGDLLTQGVEEVECALQHVLAEGTPPAAADLWVTLRAEDAEQPRRCWRSAFVRLASPLADEEPVPLGVAWLFQDVTDAKQAEQDGALLRFRARQLHRAGRVAAECQDPDEAAAVHLDFALAGFADHGLVDLATGTPAPDGQPRLVRALASPDGAPGPSSPAPATGIPVPYPRGHPAAQAYERRGSVRTSAGPDASDDWAAVRKWPEGTVHGLCVVLRSRGRTLGVATFLRNPARRPFDHADAAYAEEVAARIAAALDLYRATAS